MFTVLFSTAYAADQAAAGGGTFSLQTLTSVAPIVLIFVVFYFLLIKPQQKRQRELREKQGALRRGDKIVTAGGIVGVVQATREDSPEVDVEIAPNVRVKIVRSTISTVIPRDQPANDA